MVKLASDGLVLGYRGQIYDEHPVVSGLFVEFRLLMFRCSDRILNCLIRSDMLQITSMQLTSLRLGDIFLTHWYIMLGSLFLYGLCFVNSIK